MQTSAIREVLLATAGVQSVGAIAAVELADGGHLVTARLGFGPSTPVGDIVTILDAVRTGIRAVAPEASDIVLEPEIAAPRDDANPPTDVFVIRGAD
jgi:divalent metal cation (Fe/Co/Zn/Cd) transporter